MRRSKVLLGLCVLTVAAAGESNAGIIPYLQGQGYTDIADQFNFSTITSGTDISGTDFAIAQKGYVHHNSGLDATENWADANTTLFWDITEGDQYMNYRYTFFVAESYNGNNNTKDISHVMFQVTDGDYEFGFGNVIDMKFSYGNIGDITVNGNVEYSQIPGSLPGDADPDTSIEDQSLPDDNSDLLRWFKIEAPDEDQFDATIWTVEFDSDRVAMWGNFYAKDGKNVKNGENGGNGNFVLAYNTGLTDGSGVLIPVPNGETYTPPLPEPASLMIWSLLGASIVGITAMRRRKDSRSA